MLYGTTTSGGAGAGCSNGCGTFFQLTPPLAPGGFWTESVLHSFTGQGGDGSQPSGSLAIGKDGALYGTTRSGGASGLGTVYRMTPPGTSGGPWTETVLLSFTAITGYAANGLVIDSDGVLYGTTSSGYGAIFSLRQPSMPGGAWTGTVLFHFNQTDGANPNGLALGAGGVLYGTTYLGGSSACAGGAGCGTVFELAPPTPTGVSWTQTVLCNLGGSGPCRYGIWPMTGVAIAKNGTLYGTTTYGGPSNTGTLFALTPPTASGGAWTQTLLHTWGVGPIGGGLIVGDNGALYGTTFLGGNNNAGTIFEWKP